MKNLGKLLSIFSVAIFIGCGDEKKVDEESVTIGKEGTLKQIEQLDSENDSVQMNTENIEKDGVVHIELTGNDLMQFNKNEIKVKAGQTIKLTLKHVGEMPEKAMGHNFVLLKKGADVMDFAQEAATATNNEYIPKGTDKVIAKTELIGGGEETTIEFKAPEAGTYDYICSFPGHYIQMRGKFIVM
jgi:azurin